MGKMTKKNWENNKYFSPVEFKCPCGCDSHPEDMDYYLIRILTKLRQKYGPVRVTCGVRCQKYNDSLKGSVKNSYHVKHKAADIYIKGICDTDKGRQELIKYARKWKGFKYAYCNIGGNHPNMGNAVHIEVR